MLLFAHTNLYTYARLVDNNEAKRQFFPRFWIIGTDKNMFSSLWTIKGLRVLKEVLYVDQ